MKSAGVPVVFIIDDDRGMRQSIQDLVESVGLHAESFATGGEFLNRKRTNDPSCLVLDVRLPQMSGLDFQRQLAEAGMQIPIIFVTTHGDVPMSVRALKSGAVEFLTKPIRHQDLLEAVSLRSRSRKSLRPLLTKLRISPTRDSIDSGAADNNRSAMPWSSSSFRPISSRSDFECPDSATAETKRRTSACSRVFC
jgi:DNA-binding response OmpR family regulator